MSYRSGRMGVCGVIPSTRLTNSLLAKFMVPAGVGRW